MSDELPDSIKNRPDGGPEMKGPIPAAMKAALRAVRQDRGVKDADGEGNSKSGMKFATPKGGASQVRATGSPDLERIVEKMAGVCAVYDEVVLPSLGKFYNGKDGPTDGTIHIRPMTGEEEQILATPKYVRKGHAIDMIYQRCLKESYPPHELLSIDRTYLLIWLRGISYTPKYEVEVRCPDTDNKFQTELDLREIEVNYCPEDFGPENLQGVLPRSGLRFEYRLSRGIDERQVQDYREKHIKAYGDQGSDDTLTYRTALLLNNIDGLKAKLELQVLLRKLPIQDVNYLRNIISEPPFGVDTKVNIFSPYTTNEFTIDLPLEANFFFPRLRKKKKDELEPSPTPTNEVS
jgi:hypothetical protein